MGLFQAPLDTCLGSPFLRLCQSLNSRFALHGLRGFEQRRASPNRENPPVETSLAYRREALSCFLIAQVSRGMLQNAGVSHRYVRSRPSKPNQRKGQNEKFVNFALFCEFWCFSLGKQARFTLNFCPGMPLRKVHELWFAGATPEYVCVNDNYQSYDCNAHTQESPYP